MDPEVKTGVTYEITLPAGPQTRGEDGYATYDLHYEVYKTVDAAALETAPLLFEETVTMTGNTTKLTLDLLNDQDYTVLFWANKEGMDYFDLRDLRQVGVKQAASNNDDRDAFCGMDQLAQHDGAQSKTVELKRPFAQINIATLVNAVDYDINPVSSLVKVKDIPVSYNVFTGEPVGAEGEVEYTVNTVPTGNLTVNGTDYKKVAMNYALVPATADNSATVEVYYEINTANGTVKNSIPNVPVKKNYRTNIIGNLLTSNASYTIELKPGFDEGDFYGPEFVKTPAYDEATKTWTITCLDELLYVAQQVNTGANSFVGQTVKVVNDIDLKNIPWTPIGHSTTVTFRGMFEGAAITKAATEYPTISNLKIENGSCSGFFGLMCNGGKVRNINFNNVTISGERQLGTVVGQVYGNLEQPTIENVTVENAVITAVPALDGTVYDNGDKVGGIAGLIGQNAYIKGCTVKNSTFTGYRDLGGILGCSQNGYSCNLTGNHAENINFVVTSNYAPYSGNTPAGATGAIRGGTRSNAADVIEGNTYSEVAEVVTVNDQSSLQYAIDAAGDGDVIALADGEYELPSALFGQASSGTFTIEGNGVDTEVKGAVNANANHPGVYAHGKHLVFKDLTYITPNNGYNGGFGHAASVTFINCTIIGQYYAHSGAPHYFYDCTIDPLTGYLYTYGSDCVFEGCTFSASEGKALQVYEDGTSGENTVTIKDCQFVAAKQAATWDGKPVTGIDINSNGAIFNVYVENCTTTDFPTGLNSGSDLYNIKDGGLTRVNLWIDGVQVAFVGMTPVAEGVALDAAGAYNIFNADGMLWFANEVNVKGNTFSGKIVKLIADIDLAGIDWQPISQTVTGKQFKGTFDGQDNTIYNLTVNTTNKGGSYASGLFGWILAAKVKNVNIDGADIQAQHYVGTIAGYLEYTGCTVENCHVTNANIVAQHNAVECGNKVGGIVGFAGNANTLVKGCTVSNSTIVADRDAGQVVGAAMTANVVDCSATNVQVSAATGCTDSASGTNIRNEVIGRVL